MMVDKFSSKYEDIIAKYMPKFAAIESEKARKRWGYGANKLDGTPKKPPSKNGGKPKSDLDKKMLAHVKRLRKSGWSQEDIAKLVNISMYTTQRYLAALSMGRISKASLPKPAQQILELIDCNTSLAKIAMFMDMTEDEVDAIITEYNLWDAGPSNQNNN
jgi:hypothetical protein